MQDNSQWLCALSWWGWYLVLSLSGHIRISYHGCIEHQDISLLFDPFSFGKHPGTFVRRKAYVWSDIFLYVCWKLLGGRFPVWDYALETILASNLEYLFELSNLSVISSNVGTLWFSQIMALLRSLGPGMPLTLWGYINELTKCVGFKCGVMISCAVISISYLSISSLASVGTLCSMCWPGRCDGVFICHTAYLVEGIQGDTLQIITAVDGFMVM